jgi:hypothetical protein
MVWQLTALNLNVATERCFNTYRPPGPVAPARNINKDPDHTSKA